ncbi:uncharacterized protein LOC107022083 [Solanum pennellii]|uniref:Uncharacterized protein LOC107022083 n=1 Tax=Solanum pennellii TaxID=28526 RepID=A0ABM1GZR5_SOLPN|nr:uncharacterized protein LOC107022083 [Solanum pennellii]
MVRRSINNNDNADLDVAPTLHEIKYSVFSIDLDSAASPDGLNGIFYQTSWGIIVEDLHKVVVYFFQGVNLPKFFTHTCIVLLPKVEAPQEFKDFSNISLCNVSGKIISKVINNRLSRILPKIISHNQSGFVKGRSIADNVLLAQEIISDIPKPKKGKNMVIKLDMAKAYATVSWPFLCFMMRQMGFSKNRLISSSDLSPTIGTPW